MASVISSPPASTEVNMPMPKPQTEVDAWSEEELEEESLLENQETTALIGSMLVHLIIILGLALIPTRKDDDEAVVLLSPPPDYSEEKVETIEDVTYSQLPQEAVGANSIAEAEMAEA